jgi:hypothetical protein
MHLSKIFCGVCGRQMSVHVCRMIPIIRTASCCDCCSLALVRFAEHCISLQTAFQNPVSVQTTCAMRHGVLASSTVLLCSQLSPTRYVNDVSVPSQQPQSTTQRGFAKPHARQFCAAIFPEPCMLCVAGGVGRLILGQAPPVSGFASFSIFAALAPFA